MEHGRASSVDHHVAAAICWSSLYSSEPLISFLLLRLTASICELNPSLCPTVVFIPVHKNPSISLSPLQLSSFRSLLRLAGLHCLVRVTQTHSRTHTHTHTHTSTHTKLNYGDGTGRGSEREIGQSACTPPLLNPPSLSWLDRKVGQARGHAHTHKHPHARTHTHTHTQLQMGSMCV